METKEQNAGQTLQSAAGSAAAPVSKEKIWEALSQVYDPELQMSIVLLGLVYGVDVREGNVDIKMTLTSPGCPYGPELVAIVEDAARSVQGVKAVSVDLVWEPPWGPDKMTEEARLDLGFEI
jgi:metal-sulfur cluster biosynthetic enzyme